MRSNGTALDLSVLSKMEGSAGPPARAAQTARAARPARSAASGACSERRDERAARKKRRGACPAVTFESLSPFRLSSAQCSWRLFVRVRHRHSKRSHGARAGRFEHQPGAARNSCVCHRVHSDFGLGVVGPPEQDFRAPPMHHTCFCRVCGRLSVARPRAILHYARHGKAIVGVGIGVASMTTPIFIAEVAPPESRGSLVTVNNLFITGGQFFASLTSAGLATWLPVQLAWRWMFAIGALPAAIQMIGFTCFVPESPRWLVMAGKLNQARNVLVRLRGISMEDHETRAGVELELSRWRESGGQKSGGCWKDVKTACRVPHIRKALLVGTGLQFLQQMVGINTVMYYGATIVQMAGFSGATTAIYANVGLAATNFLFTIVGIKLVDTVGRRACSGISCWRDAITGTHRRVLLRQ